MNAERLLRAKEIFSAALDESSPEARAQRVREMAAGDSGLEGAVQQLLELHSAPSLTLDRLMVQRRAGEVLAGRYRIEALIASGGMGEVYRAVDLANGAVEVAIKTVRPLLWVGEHAGRRFLREFQLARQIPDHPNVCRMLDLFEHEGQHYCAMEFLAGETLSERLRRAGPMNTAEALPIVAGLCAGLTAAHEAGVVHRDLKPSNVVLTADGRAVIIDFGLAAGVAHDSSLTADGAVIGTLAYMAPEQLAEGATSAASDIYTLGVLMYEMLTGQKPHGTASPLRMAARKAASAPQVARRLDGVPWVWRETIERCLQPEPAGRFGSAREVELALRGTRPSVRFLLSRRRFALPLAATIVAFAAFVVLGWLRTGYTPAPEAGRLYEQAQTAMNEAAPFRATQLLEQALAADPAYLSARALAAAAYAELDQPERAREEVLEASGVAEKRWGLGRVEQASLRAARAVVMSDHKRAAEEYERLAGLTSGHGRTFAKLAAARAIEQSGDRDGALRAVEAVLRESPSNPAARLRLGLLLSRAGANERARAEFDAAEALLEGTGNTEGLCDVLLARASAPADRARLERVLALSGKTGNRYHNLMAKSRLAVAAVSRLEYDEAVRLSREAAEQARRDGMPIVAAQALGELGYAFYFKKRPEQAEPILRESVELAERARATGVLASNRMRLGEVVNSQQRTAEAAAIMEPAITWLRSSGRRDALPLMLMKWGVVLNNTARFAEAEGVFREALDLATADRNEFYQAIALERIATFLDSRDPAKALPYWDRSVALARKTRFIRAFAFAARNATSLGQFSRADALLAEGEAETRNHPAGIDRNGFEGLNFIVRANTAFQRGDCAAARAAGAEALKREPSREREVRMLNVACDPHDRRSAAWLQNDAPKWTGYQRAANGLRIAALYLRLGNAQAAKRAAESGLADSLSFRYRLFELENTIALRAAESRLGNAAEVSRLTARVRDLAAALGFNPADRFGGRRDLLDLWSSASPLPSLNGEKYP